MEKYNLIPEQLQYEGTIGPENLFEPEPLDEASILLTHTETYWRQLKEQTLSRQEIRRMGFPLSERLVHREIVISKGTLMCAHFALQHGAAMNVSGGTHHAFTNRGEGFCLLNDIALAANCLLRDGLARQILVIDLDVHQGNGTAEIFRHEPRVFTFSMHCAVNFPMEKEQSDLDVPLAQGMEDAEYMRILERTLPPLLDQVQPDFCFYLSGVDILATDKLGKLNLSRAGCKARDRFVFELLQENGLPVAVSMGGGYSVQLRDIVEAHCNTFRVAAELFA